MTFTQRINFRITLVILLCFLPTAGILCYLYFSLHHSIHLEHERSAQQLADTTAAIHQQWINEAERSARILSISPSLTQSRHDEASQLFKDMAIDNPNIHNIIMVNHEGTLVASGKPWQDKVSYADRSWFQRISEGEEYSLSKVLIGRLNKKPLVSLAIPVRNDQGARVGVISLGYGISHLNEEIDHLDFQDGDHYFLMNDQGDIYHSYPDVKREASNIPNHDQLLQYIQSGKTNPLYIESNDTVYAFSKLNHSGPPLYSVVGVHEDSSSFAALTPWYVILLIMLLSGIVIFLMAMINAWFSVIRPAKILAEATVEAKEIKSSLNLKMPGACLELQQVAHAFQEMHQTLDQQHQNLVEDQNKLESLNQQLSESIRVDLLTGAYSRRHGLLLIEQEIERFVRYQTPVSILLIDLDYFKGINDEHGHQVGDQALVTVVDFLKARLRTNDHIIRYAGDEFIVILSNAGVDEAQIVSESLLAQNIVVEGEGLQIELTLSIGIATVNKEITCELLIDQADQAMYQAKKKGKARYDVHRDL